MKCLFLSRPARTLRLAGLLLLGSGRAPAAWPDRPAGAPAGSEVAREITDLGLEAREAVLRREILSGNVPEFLRKFVPVTVRTGSDSVVLEVAPDYLAVGTDDDYFQTPLTPGTANAVAARLGCVLPSRKIVDHIHAAAALKLPPLPRPPGPDMTTVPAFLEYGRTLAAQRRELLSGLSHPAPRNLLVAGHHKDVVSTPALDGLPGHVAIYGWHRPDGTPIQPLYTGHADTWVDYSHGVRLVSNAVLRNGQPSTVAAILADPGSACLLSDEVPAGTTPADEVLSEFSPEPGVRVVLNRPAAAEPDRPVRLILYAVPNGSTIEQTMGCPVRSEPDWRFGIQHIAAQTRWLRHRLPETTLVMAYLECEGKSWPAWCRQHSDRSRRIAGIVDAVRRRCGAPGLKMVLTGHSGGGAFVFRYLDSRPQIPEDVERIAFLDSNYAYDAAKGHGTKLAAWLRGDSHRFLTVIAYHDSAALLEGKPFVSEPGGTWGRSHAMLEDLGSAFAFDRNQEGNLRRASALDGRIGFLLLENPEKAVLHTLLVERNGFLAAMLSGTRLEETGYRFLGDPVYRGWIRSGVE